MQLVGRVGGARPLSRPKVTEKQLVTKIALRRGGLDTGFALFDHRLHDNSVGRVERVIVSLVPRPTGNKKTEYFM